MTQGKRKATQQVRRKQVSFLVNEREHAALARKARAARVSAGEYIRNTCGLSASKRNAGARGGRPEPDVSEVSDEASCNLLLSPEQLSTILSDKPDAQGSDEQVHIPFAQQMQDSGLSDAEWIAKQGFPLEDAEQVQGSEYAYGERNALVRAYPFTESEPVMGENKMQTWAERILSQASSAQASAMDTPAYDPAMAEQVMLAEMERIENDERIEAITFERNAEYLTQIDAEVSL